MKKSTTVSKACQPKSVKFYHLGETGDIMKLILLDILLFLHMFTNTFTVGLKLPFEVLS